MAVSGDTAAVGAPGVEYEEGEYLLGGHAHVFVRTGTARTEQIKLFPPDLRVGDRFGASVAILGDTGRGRHAEVVGYFR